MGCIRRLLAKLHGNFTPAWFSCGPTHCLRRFERSDYGYKGVSAFCAVVAHNAATLVSRYGVGRSAFPVGESVMAHPPHGSAQKECVCLPYTAPPLSCAAFFVKVQSKTGQYQLTRARKGSETRAGYVGLTRQHLKTRYDTIQQPCL